MSGEEEVLERIERWRRHRPKLKDEFVNSAHGAGGKASAALIDSVFLEAFRNKTLEAMADGAVLELPSGERIAFSTDSFVVKPLRFPGGSIGDLAVNGTVNDLAMMGANPLWISAAFVLEDGFPIRDLRDIVADMAAAAQKAGVQIVTGDTKVVNRGAADGVYITTAGVGVVPAGVRLDSRSVRAGDKVIVSGMIGDHGVAVLIARGELALEADIPTDSAPLNELVATLLEAAPQTRFLRDPTRGGVATVLNEMARDAEVSVVINETALPVRNIVNGACEILGIDPLYVANEGKLVAVVPPDETDAALAALRALPLGADAAVIGEVRGDPPGIVVLNTGFGGTRIVDMLVG
ncbi:MAG: hydrogenase expression/formation protein HypE, partial [Acidimicrobiales bacterium]